MKNVQSWNSFKNLKTNNSPLSEKRVGKSTWKFMSDDERMDALLSVVKDPDEAAKYIELDWDDLPARINPQNMRIFEKSGIVNEAAKTQFTKPGKDGQPAKDGDIYFSKREGNAIAVKRGDTLQSVYVYDGQPKLGKIHKTDKRWENMGPLSRGLLTDLTAKGVGGLYTRKVAAEDAKILLQFLSDMTESVNEEKKFSSYEQKMVNQIKRALEENIPIYNLPMKTQKFYRKNKDMFAESISEEVDLVHVYDESGKKVIGTGQIVQDTKRGKRDKNQVLVQFDRELIKSYPKDRVRAVESVVNERLNVSRDALNKVYKELGATSFAQMILKLRDENALDDLVDALSNEYPRIMR